MRKRQRTLIPEKAQIPLMIGGLILLVIVILWNYVLPALSKPEATVSMPPEASVPTAVPADNSAPAAPALPAEDNVEAVRTLIAALQEHLLPAATPVVAPPPVISNPFSPLAAGDAPQLTPTEETTSVQEGDFIPLEPMEDPELPLALSRQEIERLDRLSGLRLTGTLKTGGWAMAVINGGYYRQGDKVEGFTLVKIDEKQVSLQDDTGTEILPLDTQDTFQTPRMTLPAPARQDAPFIAEDSESTTLGDNAL